MTCTHLSAVAILLAAPVAGMAADTIGAPQEINWAPGPASITEVLVSRLS